VDRRPPDRLTWFLAIGIALAVAVGGAISTLVRYDVLGVGHLPRVALFPAFLLVLLNAVGWRLARRRWLDSRRLMYVYVAVLATANIMGVELVIRQYLLMIAAQGYATPENQVAQVVLPHVAEWMVPALDRTPPPSAMRSRACRPGPMSRGGRG